MSWGRWGNGEDCGFPAPIDHRLRAKHDGYRGIEATTATRMNSLGMVATVYAEAVLRKPSRRCGRQYDDCDLASTWPDRPGPPEFIESR